MLIIPLVLLVLLLITLALFLVPVRIDSLVDTSTPEVYARATWSFIKSDVRLIGGRLYLRVFLLKLKIVSRFLRRDKKKQGTPPAFQTLKALKLEHTTLDVRYGFGEPFVTGIALAAASFIATLFGSAKIGMYPEFLPETEFMQIKARTELHMGGTIVNLIKQKLKRRKQYGSTELS